MRTNKSQGICDTTLTERFVPFQCKCSTYQGNLGPCKECEIGLNNRCNFCDHLPECHVLFGAKD